jgi:chromosomal replication initiator protein
MFIERLELVDTMWIFRDFGCHWLRKTGVNMAEWDYEIFWNETMNQMQEELGENEFNRWFRLVKYQNAGESAITLAVPSAFYREQIKSKYQNSIQAKLKLIIGRDVALNFEVVAAMKAAPAEPSAEKPVKEHPSEAPQIERKQAPVQQQAKGRHPLLREDYTFERYIIGENNSFAANAAIAISKNPGTVYNPFLIYGGVGLGKTHLMQGIGNYIHEYSNSKIIYITAEDFTNEFIQSLNENRTAISAFKNKYRFVDVLLIDDIHFLQKKDGTQEELFYTFNALKDARKQMVFTCDRPVSELKNFTERLKSRFSSGLNLDLLPPNYETRCAILKSKMQDRHVSIPDEVIALVSKNVSTNVRDLEAALTKLIAYAELVGKAITVQIAQQQLKDVFASPRQPNMSIDIIQRVTAEYFSLSPNDMRGRKKTQNIVQPRQLAMYIVREITEFSTTEIGEAFGGRDHTTVMHACQKIEDRIRAEPALDSTIQTIIRMIKEYSAKS